MEVTCERCKAEYDFDDSLVGESGTTVKCTDCGHIFRVFPGQGANRSKLQIRFRDGRVETLDSLRELQHRARHGQVTLDDEIGRDGFNWRPLRAVPELKGFFASQSAAGNGGSGATPAPGSLAVTPSVRPGDPSSAPPPQAQQGKRTMLGMGPAAGAATQRAGSPPSRAASPVGAAPAQPSRSSTPPPPASSSAAARGRGSKPAPAPAPGSKLYLSDDDAPDFRPGQRPAGGGGLRWVGLAVLLAGGAWLGINALSSSKLESKAATDVSPEPDEVLAQDGTGEAGVEAGVENPTVEPLAATGDDEQAQAGSETEDVEAEPADKEPTGRAGRKRRAKQRRAKRDDRAPLKGDYSTLVGRGDKYLNSGNFAKAQEAFEKALAQRSSGSEANSGLGFALLGQGSAGKAVPHFKRAARNGFAAAHLGLGDAYAKMGQKGDAVKAYRAYLARLPQGGKASYARKQIDALQSKAARPKPKAPAPAPAPAPAAEPTPSALEDEPPPTPAGAMEEEPQPDTGEEYVPAGAMSEDEE